MSAGKKLEKMKGMLLKKNVGTIHIAADLSLLQRKIFNALFYNAFDNLLTKEMHEITYGELSDLVGYNSLDRKKLKDAFGVLISTKIKWDVFEETGLSEEHECTLVSGVSRTGKSCKYSYYPPFRELLAHPEKYGLIDLKVQARFRSAYGLALYENCIRYEKIPRTPQTPWWTLDEFRSIMGLPESKYNNPCDLRKRVIKTGIEEVNEHSPINLKVEYRTVGGKIDKIKFYIEKKNAPSIIDARPIQDPIPEILPHLSDQDERPCLIELKEKFGFTDRAAEMLLKKYGEEYILATAKMVSENSRFKEGKIKNPAGFLTRALEDDYSQSRENNMAPTVQIKPVNDIYEIRKKYDRYLESALRNAHLACHDKEKKLLEKQFGEYLGEGLFKDSYNTVGLSDPLVCRQFVEFLVKSKHPLLQGVETFTVFRTKQKEVS